MTPLVAIALQAGFPMIKAILERKLGDKGGALVADVIGAVANRAGVAPEQLETVAVETPGKIIDAMRQVEPMTPELVALYTSGLQHQFDLLQAEMAEGGWKAAWRPAGMWFILFLWFYQIVGLHTANAIFKIALPAAPWEHLITFTGFYMALYMGGHTIKDVVANLAGARR
ncbi:MAG: hypothetical protein MUE83_00965 [Tabrizicola sp.]|jgi:hypothetical protein|nr:hypothetical protein [Tabrizicola sp.]